MPCSETMIHKITVDILEAVVPKEENVAAGDLLDPGPDQLCDLLEVRPPCGHVPWIHICPLEVREEELARGGVVAVGPEDHVWQPEPGGNGRKSSYTPTR